MKRVIIAMILFIILAVIAGALWFSDYFSRNRSIPTLSDITNNETPEDIPRLTTIADNFEVPWDIAFLPDGNMLVTERPGRVQRVTTETGEKTLIAEIEGVNQIGEGGLHGITLHPEFSDNNFVYLYYTYSDNGNQTLNRVSRFEYANESLANEQTIIEDIPGAQFHDGGKIAFGPDDMLYITTGDAQQEALAQNVNSLAGKILRITDSGQAAPDNPSLLPQADPPGDPRIYSYGHRNSQGICWDAENNLYATEHGRSGAQSGFDELNRILQGVNYGWPTIQGNETRANMQTPLLQSGPTTTWAPAGAACLDDSVFFGGLRGNALYEAVVQGEDVELETHLNGELGRIRAVVKGPDGMIYISTSNRDGRGLPDSSDDRIIRVNPNKL